MQKGEGYNSDTVKRIHSGNANYCANSAAIVPASQPQSAGGIQVFPEPNIRLQHATKTLDLELFVHPTQISPPAVAPETLWNAFTDHADIVSADSVTQRICDDGSKARRLARIGGTHVRWKCTPSG